MSHDIHQHSIRLIMFISLGLCYNIWTPNGARMREVGGDIKRSSTACVFVCFAWWWAGMWGMMGRSCIYCCCCWGGMWIILGVYTQRKHRYCWLHIYIYIFLRSPWGHWLTWERAEEHVAGLRVLRPFPWPPKALYLTQKRYSDFFPLSLSPFDLVSLLLPSGVHLSLPPLFSLSLSLSFPFPLSPLSFPLLCRWWWPPALQPKESRPITHKKKKLFGFCLILSFLFFFFFSYSKCFFPVVA